MVNAVSEEHPGRFKVDNRPAEGHRGELDKLSIKDHGVVCMRGDEVLWKHADHKMSKADLDAGLQIVLAALK